MKENKYALVAGGAGFVGSHLCRRLLTSGYSKVICLDSLLTGSMSNISDLVASSNFVFIRKDITEKIFVEDELDEIYNLACPASPLHYRKAPIHTFKTSIIGSINLLELAREKGARILLASTSEIYGDPLISPQSETYWGNANTYGTRSCYDEGKRGAETLFHDYHDEYRVDTRIVRIFNTYGPYMKISDGRVIPNFIIQSLKGENLTIHGDGCQTRSFLYIDDLVDAILQIMEDDVPHYPINIGNPSEMRIKDLAVLILRMTKSTSKLLFTTPQKDDPRQRKPDISIAENVLKGWKPKVCLIDGIARTIKFFEKTASLKRC